jgi:abortive infection bacteriophage resistance protein
MIDILQSRNLTVDESAIPILQRENYYNLINGYKDLFLDASSPVERYLDGTTFFDIYNLFCLDRDVSHLYFKMILEIETTLRSVISYRASEYYGNDNQEFYLKLETYTSDTAKTNQVNELIKRMRELHQSRTDSIVHYRNKHGNVPFWVIVKDMTLGSLSIFYSLLRNKQLQSKIAKDLQLMCVEQTGSKKHFKTSLVIRDLRVLTEFRNVCAHSERFFCHVSKQINIEPDLKADTTHLIEVFSRYSLSDSFYRFIWELIQTFEEYVKLGKYHDSQFQAFTKFIGVAVSLDSLSIGNIAGRE